MENPVERAVNEATAETLQMPDQKLMKQVADLVNTRTDLPKLAVQAIGKRLMQIRNGKVQALSMELIEYLAFTCETPFFTQIATNDFLQRFNTLLNPNMNPQMQQRLLQVIFILRQLMAPHQDLYPTFFQFIQKVQAKTPLPSNYESKYVALRRSPAFTTKTSANPLIPENAKHAKLKRDLEIVKSNIHLTNEIIDNSNPLEDQSKNEILKDMVATLKGVEEKLRNLITNMGGNDEGMMSYCLELNDDLQKTFERYETLKRRQKPAPFKAENFQFTNNQQPPAQQVPKNSEAQQPVFSAFQQPTQVVQQVNPIAQMPSPPAPKAQPQQIDLLDLFETEEQPKPQQVAQKKQEQKLQEITDLFDMDDPQPQPQPQPQQQQQQQIPLDLFSQNQHQPQIQQQQKNPIQNQQGFPQQLSQQPLQQQQQQPIQQFPNQSQIPQVQQFSGIPQQNYQGSYIPQQQQQYGQQYPQQQQQQQPQMGNMSAQQAFSQMQPQQRYPGYQMPPQQQQQGYGQQIPQGYPQMNQGYGIAPQQNYQQPLNYPQPQQVQQKDALNEFDDILKMAMSNKNKTDLV